MPNAISVEVTARDNRLGWWGTFHHYQFSVDSINDICSKVFDKLHSYETPERIVVDGRTVYTRGYEHGNQLADR